MKKHFPANDRTSGQDDASQNCRTNMDAPFGASLYDTLNQLQTMAPETPPSLHQFRQFVQDTKLRERRHMRRDLLLFLAAAVLISTGWLFSMTLDPKVSNGLLVAISILSVTATPIVYVLYRHLGETSA